MNNEEKRELCLSLMRADSEAAVIEILNAAGYWDNKRVWRDYGDNENNFSSIGNQQNRPDAALVEKLINSVDARLMHECMARGIKPQSPAAPKDIREAVAHFFEEEKQGGSVFSGQIQAWPDEKRREVARGITLAATGAKGSDGDPCLANGDLTANRACLHAASSKPNSFSVCALLSTVFSSSSRKLHGPTASRAAAFHRSGESSIARRKTVTTTGAFRRHGFRQSSF
jgi:hypothetical protein